MKASVCLIAPPMISTYTNGFYTGRRGGPPLNLAYLARVLAMANVDYDIIDAMSEGEVVSTFKNHSLKGTPLNNIISKISDQVNIVGITSMFSSEWVIVRELAEKIKVKYPDIVIVIGGEHATADAWNIIKYEQCIDYCFLGESEVSFGFFIQNFSTSLERETPGVAYRNDKDVIINPRAQRLANIDDLEPLWEKIPVRYYLDKKLSISRLGTRALPILTTRGCPYTCTFCSNKNMWGVRYVTKSPKLVVDEMIKYVNIYNVEHFDFLDLATSVNKKWFKELLETIIERLPGISWEMSVGTRSEILDYEILSLIKKSGNYKIGYAPETGSSVMAKKIKKRINLKVLIKSMKIASRLGLDVKANLIIGFPGETLWQLLMTICTGLHFGWNGVKGVSVFKFDPYPGSELAEQFYKKKYNNVHEYHLAVDRNSATGGAKVLNITDIFLKPTEQFYALIANSTMVFSYLLCVIRRPKYIVEFIVNLKTGKPTCAVEVAVHSILLKYIKSPVKN